MDKKTFCDIYEITRRQLDRLLVGASDSGRFECHGAYFIAKKTGDFKSAPVDIIPCKGEVAVSSSAGHDAAGCSAEAAVGPDTEDLFGLSKEELSKRKTIEEIRKIRQLTREGRDEIRKEVIADITPALISALSPLRDALQELDLSAEKLDFLKKILQKSVEALHEVR